MSELSQRIRERHKGTDDEQWECDCSFANQCMQIRAAEEIEALEKDLKFTAVELVRLFEKQPWGAYVGAMSEDDQFKRICEIARSAR